MHLTCTRFWGAGRDFKMVEAKHLVLSHLTPAVAGANNAEQFGICNLPAAVAEVRKRFTGRIDVAAELKCIPLP